MMGILDCGRERVDPPVTVVHGLYVRFRQIIHEFAKFGIIGVIGLAITNVGYALLHSNGVGPVTSTTIATIIALNTGIAIATVFRFWSYRRFVWRMSPAGEAGTGAVPGPTAPSGQPSAAAQVPAAQNGAERLPQAGNGAPHQNGHAPAGRAARRGTFTRS